MTCFKILFFFFAYSVLGSEQVLYSSSTANENLSSNINRIEFLSENVTIPPNSEIVGYIVRVPVALEQSTVNRNDNLNEKVTQPQSYETIGYFSHVPVASNRHESKKDINGDNNLDENVKLPQLIDSVNKPSTENVHNYDIDKSTVGSVEDIEQHPNSSPARPLNPTISKAVNINHQSTVGSGNKTSNIDSVKNLDLNLLQQNSSDRKNQGVNPNVVAPYEYEILAIDVKSNRTVKKFRVNSFDENSSLDEVRKKLKSQGLLVEDRFLRKENDRYLYIYNETNLTLNDVKYKNAVFFDFDSESIKKFLKGLKKDANGQLVMTNYTVAELKRYPQIRNISSSFFQRKKRFNLKAIDMIKFGITDNSSNYAEIFSYSADQQNTYRNSQTFNFPADSHSIAKYIVKEKDVKMSQDDLIISSEFYNVIYEALLPGSLQLSNAQKLLAVLKKYGWYVPLHYATGGLFYDTDTKLVYNSKEAESKSKKFLNCFQLLANYTWDEISKNEFQCKQIWRVLKFQTIDESMEKSLKSDTFQHGTTPVRRLKNILRDEKQWKIVEYQRLLPILMLLEGYNNDILSRCINLLSDFRMHLQMEEANINIKEYVLKMKQILY